MIYILLIFLTYIDAKCLINPNQFGKTKDIKDSSFAGNTLNLVEICDHTAL